MDSQLPESQTIMEAILAPDSEQFEVFLSYHMSRSSEEENSEGKKLFNLMKQMHPDALVNRLADYFDCHDHDTNTRQLCAELLGKLITEDEDFCTWHRLTVSTQSTIKIILLDHLSHEESESESIINELLTTVVKLADTLIPDNTWPELLPSMYQCATNSNSNQNFKRAAFLIFEKLAKDIGLKTFPSIKDLQPLLYSALNDDSLDLYTRIAATIAVIRFIQCVPAGSKEKNRFQDLLPGVMRTLTATLSAFRGRYSVALFVLGFLVDLAKNEPVFLRLQLVEMVNSMLDIAEDEKLDEGTRCSAVEFLMNLVEAKEKAPGMMKRVPLFISRCFTMLLNLLLDIKDDPAWHSVEPMDDIPRAYNFCAGFKFLGQFSVALGARAIAHTAKEQLSAHLVAPEWQKRYVALVALVQIGRSCSIKVVSKNWEHVVTMILNCFQHPHPRVRWAACVAIGELFKDFSPHLQELHHNRVFLTLAEAADDLQNPRVQAAAVNALMTFCFFGTLEMLIPHLDGIINKLLLLLLNGKQKVQQRALDVLSCIARSFEPGHFSTYYDTVMPHLKAVLRNADLNSDHILHAKALDCLSSVGFAGGKEKFREDAYQAMEVLRSLQGLHAKGDDLLSMFMLSAYTRICECLALDFLPYMSEVMPFVIQCAQREPGMAEFMDSDKGSACFMLSRYAAILKGDFYPWIPQVVSVVVPLIKLYTDNKVRKSAVQAMYWLLLSAKLAVEKGIAQSGSESYFTQLSDCIIQSLVEALHEERVPEICAIMLKELDKCLKICRSLLNEGLACIIIDEMKHAIEESSIRKQKLREREKTKDFDAEEAELSREEREQEEEVFNNVGKILCTLIKTFKTAFFPFLDELSSYLLPVWAKENKTKERRTSILLFDFLVEECPEAALKYYNVYLPLILDAINDEDPGVRQDALYGLRLWARYGPSSFKPFVGEALSRINVVIMHINALEPENVDAYDNAVSALGKIYEFHGESIDLAQVFPVWLNCLPIKADLFEAKYVHEQLCSMVERSGSELLGPNYHYFPKVVSVFLEVLCSEEVLATKETKSRMINVLRHLQQTIPPAIFESAWSHLLPRQEMELKSILSPEDDDASF